MVRSMVRRCACATSAHAVFKASRAADGSGWRHRAINVDEVHEGPLEARRLPLGAGEDARNRFGGSSL